MPNCTENIGDLQRLGDQAYSDPERAGSPLYQRRTRNRRILDVYSHSNGCCFILVQELRYLFVFAIFPSEDLDAVRINGQQQLSDAKLADQLITANIIRNSVDLIPPSDIELSIMVVSSFGTEVF